MAVGSSYDQYRQTQVMTAPPERLVLLTYDAAIRFLEEARTAFLEEEWIRGHEKLLRVQDILTELMCSLNFQYEVAENLYRLYEYFRFRLIEANVKKKVEPLEEVLGFLRDLRDTWHEAFFARGREVEEGQK